MPEIPTRKELIEQVKELRQSLDAYHGLIEKTQNLIYRTDLEGRISYISPSVYELSGYTAEEAIGMNMAEEVYLYPEERDDFLAKLRAEGQVSNFEARLKRKDGSVWWASTNAHFYKDREGNILGVEGITRDITEQKQFEGELKKSVNFTKSLLHAIPTPVFYKDKDGKYIGCNRAFTEIMGVASDEIKGKTVHELWPSEHAEIYHQKDLDLIENPKHQVYEFEIRDKDGNIRPVIYAKGVFYDENGIVAGLLGSFLDVTDNKLAEEEKRKALDFAAEQSKHALIGQVAGKMAHDFNNVLMGIMGNAQIAILECKDEKIKEILERINEFSERGRDISKNLMSFAKDQEPKQTYFKIEDKIDLVLKMLEKNLTGIKVSRHYKLGIPELLADPGMIQDVLVNLVQNSIHALSKIENPTLTLKAYFQDYKIYFEIEDNGCGIPKEHQGSIYTPSFTLKGSHDKTGSYKLGIQGTGYGMSNVKKYVVEKHKGDIFLESEIGKGTKITIALKIINDQLSIAEKNEVMKKQIYDKRRILLVEDEADIANVQYQILTKEPFCHIVSIAVNGQIAIDTFNRNKFNFVSLDYMLPGDINGLDVYRHIREKDKNIPVLFISGNIEFLESIKELKETDPNMEHLSKPVGNLEYVNMINNLIAKNQ